MTYASALSLERLRTAEQIARLLGLRPRTVLAMARRGALPSIRFGRKVVRFDEALTLEAAKAGGRDAAR